jgi:predicted transcriptional regulator
MKKLIVSVKTSKDVFSDFKKAFKAARKGKLSGEHYEISFDNQKDFNRFVKNIVILAAILENKPKSVYELAKIVDMDVSNLNKIILFFEEVGVIRIKETRENGRLLKTPIVEYQKIEFDLRAA